MGNAGIEPKTVKLLDSLKKLTFLAKAFLQK
jgi:hypothetical protein